MTIVNPKLELVYLETNTTSVITDEYIIKDSISFNEQLLNGLDSSSNTVSLQLQHNCPDILGNSDNCLLKTNNDVKAVLKDGNTVLFTGYLNEKINWGVTANGKKALNIMLEDVGTRLLPKYFIKDSESVVLEGNANDIIEAIAESAGITLDLSFPEIDKDVCKVVETGVSCQDLLKGLLKECGYVYYFTNLGKLNAKKIDCETTVGIPELDKSSLIIKSGSAITLNKTMRKYKSAKVTYKSLADRQGALVYKDISGQDDSNPDCKIELLAGETYPDKENGNISYIDATDLDNGKELVYIDNVVPTLRWSYGAGTSTIEQFGVKSVGVLIRCTQSGVISKLQATADIKYVDAENIIIAGNTTLSNEESNNVFEAECEWIHDRENADYYANLIVNYYKYCNKQFTFYSNLNYACGSIVKVNDNQFSGISTNILITGRTYNDKEQTYTYKGVSITEFSFEEPTRDTSTYTPPTIINTKPGPAGIGIADIHNFYAVTSVQTPPLPAEITSETIPPMDDVNRFLWRKEVTLFSDGTESIAVLLAAIHGQDSSAVDFYFTVDKQTYNRDSRSNGYQTIAITAHIIGHGETSCTIVANHGTLSTDHLVDGQTASLTIPLDNDYDVITITGHCDGDYAEIKVSSVIITSPRKNYGASTEMLNDAHYILTADEEVVPGKDYYTIVNHIGVKVENPTGNPYENGWYEFSERYIEGDAFVLQEINDNFVKSTIYIYTLVEDEDTEIESYQWAEMPTDYGYFDAIASENLRNIFANVSDTVNHVEIGQGNQLVDFYKYIIAEHISSVTYFIGTDGCIYSGCYDTNGIRKPGSTESDTGFYVSDKGELKAYIATIDKLTATDADIKGGTINVSELYCGKTDITGTIHATDGSLDLNTLTTYDTYDVSTYNFNAQPDLFSVKDLFNRMPDKNNQKSGFVSGNINMNGIYYTSYATQSTGNISGSESPLPAIYVEEPIHATVEEVACTGGTLKAGTSVMIRNLGKNVIRNWFNWTECMPGYENIDGRGTVKALIHLTLPHLYSQITDWDQYFYINFYAGSSDSWHISLNGVDENGTQHYWADAAIKDGNNPDFRGWMKGSDRIKVWIRTKSKGDKRWRFSVNRGCGEIPAPKLIGVTSLGADSYRSGNFNLTVPLGAKYVNLMYSLGQASVGVYRGNKLVSSTTIGSSSSKSTLGNVRLSVEGGDVIKFTAIGSTSVYFVHFQAAYYGAAGNNIFLKGSNTFTTLSADYNDSRNYIKGFVTGTVTADPVKISANALYEQLLNLGMVPGIEYTLDLNETAQITVNNSIKNIERVKLVANTCIAYYIAGTWYYINLLGYNYEGYYDRLGVNFTTINEAERVETKSLTPKENDSYNLGSTNKQWNNGFIKNIHTDKLTIGGITYNLSVSGTSLILTPEV